MNHRTMLTLALAAATTLGLAALTGCGGSSTPDSADSAGAGASATRAPAGPTMASVAGTYEVDKEAMKATMRAEASASNDPTAAAGVAMMEGLIDSMSWTLTLNEDGTANGVMTAMGDEERREGTWTLSGSTVTVTVSEGGVTETMSGTIKDDTLEITEMNGESGNGNTMVFKRVG